MADISLIYNAIESVYNQIVHIPRDAAMRIVPAHTRHFL